MRDMPSVLLLVLLVMAGHSRFRVAASPHQCFPDTIINNSEGNATINIVHHSASENSTKVMLTQYVHPKAGFQGVTVVVNAELRHKALYFKMDKMCFRGSADWWEVVVSATANRISKFFPALIINVQTEGCSKECVIFYFFSPITSLEILGYGTSKWKKDNLEERCGTMKKWNEYNRPFTTKSYSCPITSHPSFNHRTTITKTPHQCLPDTIIKSSEGDATINYVRHNASENSNQEILTQYVHPNPGFQGVIVVVNLRQTLFFNMDKECFHGSADWWEVLVSATTQKTIATPVMIPANLLVNVRTGSCLKGCKISGSFSPITSLHILGYGTSEWKKDYLEERCTMIKWNEYKHPFTTDSCPITSHPSVVSISKITYGGIVLIVCLVILLLWRSHRSLSPISKQVTT